MAKTQDSKTKANSEKSVTVGGVTNLKGPIKSKSSLFDHDIYQEMKKTHVEEQ